MRFDASNGDAVDLHNSTHAPASIIESSHHVARQATGRRAPSIPRKPAPLAFGNGSPPTLGKASDRLLQKRGPVPAPKVSVSTTRYSTAMPGTNEVLPPMQPATHEHPGQPWSGPRPPSAMATRMKSSSKDRVSDGLAQTQERDGNYMQIKNWIDGDSDAEVRMSSWEPLRPQ